MNLLLLITTIQSWFFSSLILSLKKQKQPSDFVLAVWLFSIGLHTLLFYLMHEQGVYNIYVAMINVAFPFLQGPFLLMYIITKTSQKKGLKRIHYLHIIPFISFIAYQFIKYHLLIQAQPNETQHSFIGFFDNFSIFSTFFLISLPIYILLSLLKTIPSSTNNINLTWVRLLILFVGGIWLSSLFSSLLPELINHQFQIKFNSLIFIFLTGFVYFISYFGIKEKFLSTDIPKIVTEKYKKSKIQDENANKLWLELQKYMETEEPYSNPELDLNKLANQLTITVNKLSQLINTKSGLNFHDYINQYRIEKTKNLIESNKFKHYSLLAIAFEAGFDSKATFNRSFKKFENCTPSEFKKNLSNL